MNVVFYLTAALGSMIVLSLFYVDYLRFHLAQSGKRIKHLEKLVDIQQESIFLQTEHIKILDEHIQILSSDKLSTDYNKSNIIQFNAFKKKNSENVN